MSITIHIWLLLLLIYGTRTDWLRLPLKLLLLLQLGTDRNEREKEIERERQSSSIAAKVNKFTPSHLKISKETTQTSRGERRGQRGDSDMSALYQTARQRPLSQSSCHIKPHDVARQVGSALGLLSFGSESYISFICIRHGCLMSHKSKLELSERDDADTDAAANTAIYAAAICLSVVPLSLSPSDSIWRVYNLFLIISFFGYLFHSFFFLLREFFVSACQLPVGSWRS